MLLPHAAWVVVADGEKYLVLENRGTLDRPELHVLAAEEAALPPTHEIGTERPGRYPASGARRSAVAQTDWKLLGKAEFAKELARLLDRAAVSGALPRFVLMADARTLGNLRAGLSPAARAQLMMEISGDFVHHQIADIASAIEMALPIRSPQ
ncbi:MAG: host attachment family protein [Kiloniellales bacterium]